MQMQIKRASARCVSLPVSRWRAASASLCRLVPTFVCFVLFAANSLGVWGEDIFIHRSGNRFYRGESTTPYIYKGASLHFAPLQRGLTHKDDRHALTAQLDSLAALGVTNLRLTASVDGQLPDSLQGDSLLRGLDFVLKEMKQRDQVAVIAFPNPEADSLTTDYAAWLNRVVKHVNRHTHRAYSDDPTIMAWQVGDSLRVSSREQGEVFLRCVRQTTRHLRSLDSHHLISVGTEGIRVCANDAALYHRLGALSSVDYLTLQLRPEAWRWVTKSSVFTALSRVYNRTADYLAEHERVAFRLRKPLVVEAVTYPHDIGLAQAGSGTQARDAYYAYVTGNLTLHHSTESALCGVRVGE